MRNSAPVFAALGDETRLRIVARLAAGGALSTAKLTEGADITRQAITKHLEVLAEAGLVVGVRSGRERRWQLEPAPLVSARQVLERVSHRWDQAIARLHALVEDE